MNSLFFVVLGTGLALCAFAANSVLCRAALGQHAIDPTSFTVLRLVAGALVLWCCVRLQKPAQTAKRAEQGYRWRAASMLFLYAAAFSYAYVSLDTGIGALVLFGTVQITLVLAHTCAGGRLSALPMAGIAMAFIGLMILLLPEQGDWQVSVLGFVVMVASGFAWGMYTYFGKRSVNPLADTATNFLRSIIFLVLLLPLFWVFAFEVSVDGVLLALCSGALTSGLGYALWYAVLPKLSTVQASALQLLVPILATLGGVVVVGETVTLKFFVSMLMVLAGISAVLFVPKPSR